MNKMIVVVLVVLAGLFSAKLYFDEVNASAVYHFCNDIAVGNSETEVTDVLTQHQQSGLSLITERQGSQQLVSNSPIIGLTQYHCEISLANNKVESLNFVKGSFL